MKKRLLVSCTILFAFLLVSVNLSVTTSVASAAPAPEIKAKVLKGVGSFRKDGTLGDSFDLFANKLKEKSKGALTLNWIGSSEAIPQADQPTAVKNGVIDFHFAAFSAYEKVLPVTIGAPLNQHTPMEDRKNGVYDFWTKAFEGFGVRYLGVSHSPGNYYFFLKKPIKNPKTDFKGMKLRTSNTYVAFIRALGAVPVTVPTDETYSALQTGLVDGSGWVCDSFDGLKGYEVLKYWVDHPFYQATTTMLINLKTWNSLDKAAQAIFNQAAMETEAERWAALRAQDAVYFKEFKTKGMSPITFTAEDAKWYLQTGRDAKWAEAKGKVSDQDYATMQKLFTKP
ncbi:MAG: TRAP transporter substrate-binding protein DctP [Deltaproteobacteria bacterium]|nr:TRAP transporter substrate-binding protein DctP [Deltaproteobacteria bacterium]